MARVLFGAMETLTDSWLGEWGSAGTGGHLVPLASELTHPGRSSSGVTLVSQLRCMLGYLSRPQKGPVGLPVLETGRETEGQPGRGLKRETACAVQLGPWEEHSGEQG